MSRFTRVCAFAAALVIACTAAYADTILLKNGRKLYGKVIKQDEKEVTISIGEDSTITVKRDQIDNIQVDDIKGPEIPPRSSSPLVPLNPEKKEGEAEEKGKDAEKPQVPAAEEEKKTEELDPQTKAEIEKFIGQLDHHDAGWRNNAQAELTRIGKAAVPALIDAMRTGLTSWKRWGAAKVLGDIGDERAIEQLVRQLRDPDRFVRDHSGQALKKITRQNFGYDPFAEPAQREAATKQWEEWWQKKKEEEARKQAEELKKLQEAQAAAAEQAKKEKEEKKQPEEPKEPPKE
jgi:hypothetical protein